MPYCLDDCGFVVESEVRQVDSSSSIILSQDYFGYSRFFCISIQIVKFRVSIFKALSPPPSFDVLLIENQEIF